jgi:trehalose 6-phosphate phosphatase
MLCPPLDRGHVDLELPPLMSTPLQAPPDVRVDEIALFLDVDGTLVEIEREPGAVHVPERLCGILVDLQEVGGGALALVSGRSLEQLDRLFSPLRLNAAGLHGLERRNLATGVVRSEPDRAVFEPARAKLDRFAEDHAGVLLEDKGLTLALHYRKAPELEKEAKALSRAVAAAGGGALVLLEGKKVLELKPPGCDKGEAIAAFMDEPPFHGRRPVFAGDDVTDEAGFATINRLGGISIRIGADSRPTAALYGHRDVSSMQDWLLGLLGALAA